MTEHTRQFIGTLLGGGALTHHVLGLCLYLAAYGGLLDGILLHGLLHAVNGLLEWIHNLTDAGVAGCGKLLLTFLEQVGSIGLHLSRHLGYCLIKLGLLCRKSLGMTLVLRGDHVITCLLTGVNKFTRLLLPILLGLACSQQETGQQSYHSTENTYYYNHNEFFLYWLRR